MRFFIEADGVLLNLKARYWHAYSAGVAKIGLARTDETTFWRLLRTGAADDRLLQRAKEHHLKVFRAEFDDALERKDALDSLAPHEDIDAALIRLIKRGRCTVFTAGSNRLDRLNQLPGSVIEENSLLDAGDIVSTAKSEPAHAVLVAEYKTARGCIDAGLRTVGIASGSSIAKRLAATGVGAVYRDLEAFVDAMDCGDEPLVRMGLVLGAQTQRADHSRSPGHDRPITRRRGSNSPRRR